MKVNLSQTHKEIGSLTVREFDLVNCFLSVVGFRPPCWEGMIAGCRKMSFHCNCMSTTRENGQPNFGALIHYLFSA